MNELASFALALVALAPPLGSSDAIDLGSAVRPALLCTQVSKTGTCDTYQGSAYCITTNGVGTLSCPAGYHHVSSSSSPDPCVPAGAACTRTINCCKDGAAPTEPETLDLQDLLVPWSAVASQESPVSRLGA
jgi:hypothetical protein